MDEISAFLALHLAFPFSPKKAKALIANWGGSAKDLWDQEFESTSPLSPILQKKLWERERELVDKAGVTLLSLNDYPETFRQLADAPILLYCKGKIPARIPLSIVGTRTPSSYGLSMASAFGNDLAAMGYTIISGLARGIDTQAHKAAVLNIGRTVAILGSGLSNIYPSENQYLADQIAERGALLSEYPMNTPPTPFQFPRRNRLIAALSQACLLIEGEEKSGSMIAMDWAWKLGKSCFTIPAPKCEKKFSGNHSLIRSGKAKLVENAQEMLSLLVPNQGHSKQFTNLISVSQEGSLPHFSEKGDLF